MFIVVEKARLLKALRMTRPDRGRSTARNPHTGPFLRVEASNHVLRVRGRQIDAEIPVTVHEEGVLFLREGHGKLEKWRPIQQVIADINGGSEDVPTTLIEAASAVLSRLNAVFVLEEVH